MIALFSCAPLELSPCSLNVLPCMGGELAKGIEKSMGFPSFCPSLSVEVKVLVPKGFFEFSSSCLLAGASSLGLSKTPFFFWFQGPLLTPVNRSGDVKGTFSSASQFPFTPAFKHSTVIVAG